jgi:hypothetical protein
MLKGLGQARLTTPSGDGILSSQSGGWRQAMTNGGARLCALLSVVTMSVSAPAVERQQPARTNPLLLSYFRQQLLELYVREDAYGRRYVDVDVRSLDSNAYALVRSFCIRVDEKLDALKQGFDQLQLARSEALRDPIEARPALRAAWSESLRHVSDEARDLHRILGLVLDGGIDAKDLSTLEMGTLELDSGFENETKAMGDQILQLDQRIRGFLSGESFTISVEELRRGDMLMLLSRVRAEAGEMRKGLDAAVPLRAQSQRRTGG